MRYILTLSILLHFHHLFAQVQPAEGSRLNYRLAGLYAPSCSNCEFQVAMGSFMDADSFARQPLLTQQSRDGRAIIELPAFGKEYTWRTMDSKKKKPGSLHHFSTMPYANAYASKVQLRIISNTGKYNDCYVFVDATHTLYNMKGEQLWFVPDSLLLSTTKTGMRDLKVTPFGTITYLAEDLATEIDYNAKVLMNATGTGEVSGDSIAHFHHQLTRLSNGHYMALGSEHIALPLPYYHPDTTHRQDSAVTRSSDGTVMQNLEFGTIIEYDATGKVIWSWKSSAYFKNSDLFTHYLPDGTFAEKDVHENAFYFDEQEKVIYLGFREVSRILKIKYPEGTVIAAYGPQLQHSIEDLYAGTWCGQHCIGKTTTGNLYIYNNNSTTFDAMPQILEVKESNDKPDGLEQIWKYDCTPDGMTENEHSSFLQQTAMLQQTNNTGVKTYPVHLSSGGNVIDMGHDAYFVSMSGVFAKMFIVNKNNEVLWSAVPELTFFPGAPPTPIATYRASIITRKQLEQLITNTRSAMLAWLFAN